MNIKRARFLKETDISSGPVIHWMSRDQRIQDNWALLYAQDLALQHQRPLAVVFCLVSEFLNATSRQYNFIIEGLKQIHQELQEKNIPFFLLTGDPSDKIPEFVLDSNAGILITDFDPLRIKKHWKNSILEKTDIPIIEVDTRNIVPCWIASQKQEFAAHTFRPKINRHLPEFLEDFPQLKPHPINWNGTTQKIDWEKAASTLNIEKIPEVSWLKSGEKAAHNTLKIFIDKKLNTYLKNRNNPVIDNLSNLSPYLHYGHISAQRVALEIQKANADQESKDAFLEELIVRRELSDNYCFYNENYDNFEGFPDWAKKTLNEHRNDKRKIIYTLEELEFAKTQDQAWNASQMEMVKTGKMHSYMRMYWAKKIVEWTESPESAQQITIYLNDKYEMDGRDSNGYTGIAWSIGGLHDRPWPEHPIIGKVRYMSYNGLKSKFNIENYIQKVYKD